MWYLLRVFSKLNKTKCEAVVGVNIWLLLFAISGVMGALKRFRFRIGKMKRKKRNSSSGFLLMWGLHIGRELQLTYPLSQMFLVAPQNLPPPPPLPRAINNDCSPSQLWASFIIWMRGTRTTYDLGPVIFSSSRAVKVVNGPYRSTERNWGDFVRWSSNSGWNRVLTLYFVTA